MTEPIIPIVPRNPNIFPVAPVGLPRIGPDERDQHKREQEEEESGPVAREERREGHGEAGGEDAGGELPQAPAPHRPQLPPTLGEDGRLHVDLSA